MIAKHSTATQYCRHQVLLKYDKMNWYINSSLIFVKNVLSFGVEPVKVIR